MNNQHAISNFLRKCRESNGTRRLQCFALRYSLKIFQMTTMTFQAWCILELFSTGQASIELVPRLLRAHQLLTTSFALLTNVQDLSVKLRNGTSSYTCGFRRSHCVQAPAYQIATKLVGGLLPSGYWREVFTKRDDM